MASTTNSETETQTTGESGGEATAEETCNESVPPETRQEMLELYWSKCQMCGARGPAAGGLAQLDCHHIERDPDDCDEHDLENLTLLCKRCHEWHHNQTEAAAVPIALTEEDEAMLLAQDLEILSILADDGPLRTSAVQDALSAELSVTAVRERLCLLMGLDTLVEGRDEQIVDQDRETNEWGLVGQIETSARGHIPDDKQLLVQRVEDERVRRALARGCPRKHVTEVLGISRRATFYKEKRAAAYRIPLDALTRGRGAVDDAEETGSDDTSSQTGESGEGESQQRLDDVAGDADGFRTDELSPVETLGDNADPTRTERNDETRAAETTAKIDMVERKLDEVIATLNGE